MPSVSELEQLSQLLAGDLSETEAQALRARLGSDPALSRALERMQRLEAGARALGAADAEPAPSAEEALITAAIQQAQRGEPPARRSTRSSRWLIAASVLLLVGVGAWIAASALQEGTAEEPPPQRAVPHTPEPAVADSSREEVRIFGGAIAGGMVFWTPDTQVSRDPDDTVQLRRGTLLVQAMGAVVRVDDLTVSVEGEAVISTEPSQAVAHVTRALSSHPKGADMLLRLDAFRDLKPSTLAGAALLVLALDGHALAQSPSGAQLVRKGEAWSQPAKSRAALTATPDAPASQKDESGRTHASARLRSARVLQGAIDLPAVHAAVLAHGGQLIRCFTSAQRRFPGVAGDVEVLLDIQRADKSGKVINATIDQSYSLNDPFVASCVVQELSTLRLPPPEGELARIAYPLGFEPRGEESDRGAMLVFPRDALSKQGGQASTFMADREERLDVRPADDAPRLGPTNAPVTLVVFSGFDCRFCVRAWPVLRDLRAQYGDRLQLVFRHKPLPKPDHARLTSAAAIAAHEQGRFWEYADLLMAQPEARDRATLEAHAAKLGLDLLRFRKALDGELAQQTLERDLAEGDRLGVKGIPSFFVNGKEIVGARPIEHYRAVIDAELARVH